MTQQTGNEDARVVGELTEDERASMLSYQRQVNQLMFQLGELAIHQNSLLKKVSSLEVEAGDQLRQVGARLGLAEDQLFRVTEGKVVLFEQKSPLQIVQTP